MTQSSSYIIINDDVHSKNNPIEVKAKENVSTRDMKGTAALKEENLLKKQVIVSLETQPRIVNGIEILPWKIFLEKLWGREFL